MNPLGWYGLNSDGGTKILGTKAANELGIFDMSGTVWEWSERWIPGYEGVNRRMLGGGWNGSDSHNALEFRLWKYPTSYKDGALGLRLALSASP